MLLKFLKYMAAALDRFLFEAFNRFFLFNKQRDIEILCFCPEGTGNLGSRALLETAFENLGPNAIFVGFDQDLFKQVGIDPSKGIIIQGMYPNFTANHFRAIFVSARLIARSKSVYVVGADNLDGAWSDMLSAVIWQFAIAAARSGSKTTIFGSSWNSRPTKFSRKSLKRAADSGVRVNARDSESFARMRQITARNIASASDIVFSKKLSTLTPAQSSQLVKPEGNYSVLCGNPGFTLEPSSFNPEIMRPILEELSHIGPIVMVPSVVRENQNDLEQIQRIYMHFRADFDLLPCNQLSSPNELRWLLRESEILVTFRMHPAILALVERKPIVMFDYQDKMRGLAVDVGIDEYCISSIDWVNSGKIAIHEALLSRPRIVQTLQSTIPGICASAMKNFS